MMMKMLMMMMTLDLEIKKGLKVSSCMRAHVSPDRCCKINPSPCRLASVHSRGLVKAKASVGAEVRDFLDVWKAWSVHGDQANSFLVLERGCSGEGVVIGDHSEVW